MTDKAPQEMESDRWAGDMGERWNTYLDQFESMIAPVGTAAITVADFKAGEQVIDIGCGGGITTFWIAELLTGSGHITGLDLSATLIATAIRRAEELGLNNIDFIQADARTADPGAKQYDCLFSRFGVMFFDDPYAAFKHMHGFVKPGGRINFACWGPPPANPWVFQFMDVARKYVEIPQADPKSPGPFAFCDTDYVTDILTQAGFKNIEFESWNGDQFLGGAGASPEVAAQFLMDTLFVGDALKDESDDVKSHAYHDLVAELQDYHTDAGVILQGNAWLVSGKS